VAVTAPASVISCNSVSADLSELDDHCVADNGGNRPTRSATSSGRSRWGTCPQPLRMCRSTGPPAWRQMNSGNRTEPYSSSSPWITRTRQLTRGRSGSRLHEANSGESTPPSTHPAPIVPSSRATFEPVKLLRLLEVGLRRLHPGDRAVLHERLGRLADDGPTGATRP
jgi:hypothetical protein